MEINIKNFSKMCRTCLSSESIFPIVGKLANDVPILDVLSYFIPSMDLKNDAFPQQICKVCIDFLNIFHNFQNTCIENEKLFKTCFEKYTANTNRTAKDNGHDVNDMSDNDNNIYSSTEDDLPLINRINQSLTRCKGKKYRRKQLGVAKGHGRNLYSCDQCDKSFHFKYKLIMHTRVHTKEKPFKCDECNLSFSLNGNLRRHKMTHSGERPHVCKVCGKGFIQSTSLHAHSQKHRKDISQRKFSCKICSRVFVRAIPYNLHMKKHHPMELQSQTTEEVNEPKSNLPKVKYKCNVCEREFDKLVFLKRHESRHGEKKFLCSNCGKGFVRKADMQSHFKIHTGEKPHKCLVCSKSFAHAGSLATHSLVHSGYKPYNCYICDKSFTQLSHLKVHQRTHNGERPYSCSHCGKTFALKSNLTVHIRIHTGETPYICTVCERGFHDSSSMKRHKSSHLNLVEKYKEEPKSPEQLLP